MHFMKIRLLFRFITCSLLLSFDECDSNRVVLEYLAVRACESPF